MEGDSEEGEEGGEEEEEDGGDGELGELGDEDRDEDRGGGGEDEDEDEGDEDEDRGGGLTRAPGGDLDRELSLRVGESRRGPLFAVGEDDDGEDERERGPERRASVSPLDVDVPSSSSNVPHPHCRARASTSIASSRRPDRASATARCDAAPPATPTTVVAGGVVVGGVVVGDAVVCALCPPPSPAFQRAEMGRTNTGAAVTDGGREEELDRGDARFEGEPNLRCPRTSEARPAPRSARSLRSLRSLPSIPSLPSLSFLSLPSSPTPASPASPLVAPACPRLHGWILKPSEGAIHDVSPRSAAATDSRMRRATSGREVVARRTMSTPSVSASWPRNRNVSRVGGGSCASVNARRRRRRRVGSLTTVGSRSVESVPGGRRMELGSPADASIRTTREVWYRDTSGTAGESDEEEAEREEEKEDEEREGGEREEEEDDDDDDQRASGLRPRFVSARGVGAVDVARLQRLLGRREDAESASFSASQRSRSTDQRPANTVAPIWSRR